MTLPAALKAGFHSAENLDVSECTVTYPAEAKKPSS